MGERALWKDVRGRSAGEAERVYEDEARVSEFQERVYRLRTEAGLTQVELAERMRITQSEVAQMEGGGVLPTQETLKELAIAVGQEEAGQASD